MKKQFAIQWLIENLNQKEFSKMTIKELIECHEELILEAISEERYEIEQAYVEGYFDASDKNENIDHKDIEFAAWCRSTYMFKDDDSIQ